MKFNLELTGSSSVSTLKCYSNLFEISQKLFNMILKVFLIGISFLIFQRIIFNADI